MTVNLNCFSENQESFPNSSKENKGDGKSVALKVYALYVLVKNM